MSRRAAEKRGRKGETRAAFWLRLKGYRVLDRRVRTPRGEIDLVMRHRDCIVFVEVKTRVQDEELAHAIDERRLARVAAAAEILAPRYATEGEDVRIDVILLSPRGRPHHIENAWIGGASV